MNVRMLFALMLLAPAMLLAQFSSGFEGTVVDASKASVPGAEVIVTNQSTQVVQTARTNDSGFFRISNLPPGGYRIEVKAAGFTTWVQTDLIVEANQMRPVFPNLAVGEAVTRVEVAAVAASVETGRATIGRVVETKTIQEIPMVGRNVYAAVVTLGPGITGSGGSFGGAGGSGSQGTNSFSQEPGFQVNAAGQRQETNEYQVDGSSVNGNSRDGIVNLTPQADTIAEVRVSANNFSAEKGRNSGALIEAYSKSGTNALHGTLSLYHTNNRLQGRTVFQRTIPVFRRNEYGGTIGGPVIKNKTFFFGSFFELRSSQALTQVVRLETPEFRNWVQANRPNSMAARFMKQAAGPVNPTTDIWDAGRVRRELASPIATPADLPDNLPVIGTATVNLSPPLTARQWNFRVDHNVRDYRDRFYVSTYRNTSDAGATATREMYRNVLPNSGLYLKASWTHMFSPNLLHETWGTYVRSGGENPGAVTGRELPNVNVTGLTGFSQWGPAGWVHNNYNFRDALSYIRGNHNVRVGFELDRQQDLDNFTLGLIRPTFNFSNILDFANDRPFSQGGQALDTRTGAAATNLYQRIHMLYWGTYVQDDWKVNRKLTINPGVRIDYFGRLGTAANGSVPFALFTPGSGSFAESIASGRMQSRSPLGHVTNNRLWGISPRIGFGYDVFGNGSLAIRGGWGVFYNRIGNLSWAAPSRSNAPDYATPTLSVLDTDPSRFTYGIGNNDGTGFLPPRGVSFQIDPRGGLVGTRTSAAGVQGDFEPPRTQNWMLSVQKRLWNDILLEADYIGSRSERLFVQTDVNRFPGDLIANAGRLTRLNPSFASVIFGRPIGVGNAHLGSFMLAKRFTKGYSLRTVYTFGKALDYTSSNDNGVGGARNVFNALNVPGQYGRSDYDIRKRLTFDSVWETPNPFRSSFLRTVVGGWTLAPILVLQSGRPFTVFTGAAFPGGDYNADGFNYDSPNTPRFGNYIKTERSDYIRGLFTAQDFPIPARGVQGDLGRNTFDGPGLANVNLNISKGFKVPWFTSEGAMFQVRGELYNLLNRVNLTQPQENIASGLFGRSTDQNLPRAAQFGLRLQF